MSSVMIVILGLAGFSFGWFVYSRFIAEKIFRLDPDFVTPAHEINDGVDFVPTNKFVLWGAHFTSVAGASPIVGPAIAIYWGWVPAVIWVTLGSIFFAGVHDMGALRHRSYSFLDCNSDGHRDRISNSTQLQLAMDLNHRCVNFVLQCLGRSRDTACTA